ncbi:hypothetical protein KY363_03790 [Candidatus Woesearchaeota archaeon]|nr:hypothetical protein [Candidatus Woesearchaeota archaeon]
MGITPSTKYLMDWFVRYMKNRDLVFRKISEITEEENKVIVHQKDGKQIHNYVEPFPEDVLATVKAIPEQEKGLVMFNSAENFSSMMKSWKELAEINNLSIYFVNPFSKLDKRWIVKPYIHGRVSDAASLKEGLNSMYLMVETISRKEAEELTK